MYYITQAPNDSIFLFLKAITLVIAVFVGFMVINQINDFNTHTYTNVKITE